MKHNAVDFSLCKRNTKTYGGANGSKIGVVYNGEDYMIKFPPKSKPNAEISYINSCFSEHISCQILKTLGIKSQETIMGTYGDKIVVACKDFTADGSRLVDFASLKNTIIDSSSGGYGTELDDILNTIDNQVTLPIQSDYMRDFFWKMFVADALLGNFDRHNGNWEFLVNDGAGKYDIAPIFACGSCLYPQADTNTMTNALNNRAFLEERIYVFPQSAIKLNNVKINYFSFLSTTDNLHCIAALEYINKRLDLAAVKQILQETPFITDLQKRFLFKMIRLERS